MEPFRPGEAKVRGKPDANCRRYLGGAGLPLRKNLHFFRASLKKFVRGFSRNALKENEREYGELSQQTVYLRVSPAEEKDFRAWALVFSVAFGGLQRGDRRGIVRSGYLRSRAKRGRTTFYKRDCCLGDLWRQI